MTDNPLTAGDLDRFRGGTDNWWRHHINRRLTYTDGVKHVAEAGGAYWLIDEIALTQVSEPAVAREEFQRWTLTVEPSRRAALVCWDGGKNGRDELEVYRKAIAFTDFPLAEITLWVSGGVILLPVEY